MSDINQPDGNTDPTVTAGTPDPYAKETVSEINEFDTQLGQDATPKTLVDGGGPDAVVDTKPEPQATESIEDDQSDEMVAPNNVHINKNVNLRLTPYEVVERKGGGIFITPKRSTRITETNGAWDVGENDNITEDQIVLLASFRAGLEASAIASYVTDDKGNLLGFYDRILDGEGNKWEQGIPGANGEFAYGRKPNLKIPQERRVISGQAARERAQRSMGLGIGNRKPLPHTGIHVELSPRSTNDYLELTARLTQDKISAGRESLGLIFQNSQASQVRIVWEFIQRSIKGANVQNFSKDTNDVDLGDIIRCTDLPILYWAQVCTMFPDGYPLDLPCSSGINICKHVERVLFDVNKGLWVNTAKLSTSQVERLHNDAHQMSANDLELYQNNSMSPLTREIRVNPTTTILLEVPSINKYLRSGIGWLGDLISRATALFADTEDSEEALGAHINAAIERSVIREYSHWVKEIVYYGTDVVEEPTDIADALGEMSTYSEELNMNVMGEIQKFIEDSTVAIIAIPNFACPICEKDHVTDEFTQHPDLIVIDMLRHFFTVKDLRVSIPTAR